MDHIAACLASKSLQARIVAAQGLEVTPVSLALMGLLAAIAMILRCCHHFHLQLLVWAVGLRCLIQLRSHIINVVGLGQEANTKAGRMNIAQPRRLNQHYGIIWRLTVSRGCGEIDRAERTLA